MVTEALAPPVLLLVPSPLREERGEGEGEGGRGKGREGERGEEGRGKGGERGGREGGGREGERERGGKGERGRGEGERERRERRGRGRGGREEEEEEEELGEGERRQKTKDRIFITTSHTIPYHWCLVDLDLYCCNTKTKYEYTVPQCATSIHALLHQTHACSTIHAAHIIMAHYSCYHVSVPCYSTAQQLL